MTDSAKQPKLEELANLSVSEFDRAMLMHFDPRSFPEIVRTYPKQVADRLEDEAEAAEHLCKWLGIGGGALPAEHLQHRLDRIAGRTPLPPGEQRQKAIEAHTDLGRLIAGDTPMILALLVHSEIREAFDNLGELLRQVPIAEQHDRPAGAPPQPHTYAAAKAIATFFPSAYPTKKAARIFVSAWQEHEALDDLEPRTKLSVESIRKTMEAARKSVVESDDCSDVFERWRSGRARK